MTDALAPGVTAFALTAAATSLCITRVHRSHRRAYISGVKRYEAERLRAAMPGARDRWMKQTAADIFVDALWLAGSLGRGEGDHWSDLDLLVVNGRLPLDDALLTLAVPHNGPAGGAYVGAMYALGELPLWVDWYQWPAFLPIPCGTRLLAGHGLASQHTLFELLDRHGRGPQAVPDATTFTLAMLPLAAKFVARGNYPAAIRMATMLGARTDPSLIDGLRELLADTPGSTAVRERIACVLDMTAALTASDTSPGHLRVDDARTIPQPVTRQEINHSGPAANNE